MTKNFLSKYPEYIRGIDLSHWNNVTDFNRIKESGIDFVMLKAMGEEIGEGIFRLDPKFLEHYRKARKAGLHVGCYMFAGKLCYNGWDAEKNAWALITTLKVNEIELDYPIAIDIEAQPANKRALLTQYVIEWCDAIERHNGFAMVYASDISGFKDRLYDAQLKDYSHWVARYIQDESKLRTKNWDIWQFTSEGEVPGIRGKVDLDYARYDFSEVIKKRGLNKFK